jgi:phosphoenolpyruvate carboxykinase (ATP)
LACEHRLERWLLRHGKRIKLAFTRAIVDAIHSGALAAAKTQHDPVFGLDAVTECPGVLTEILIPRNVWTDKSAYETTARKLADLFRNDFKAYESSVSAEVRRAAVSA